MTRPSQCRSRSSSRSSTPFAFTVSSSPNSHRTCSSVRSPATSQTNVSREHDSAHRFVTCVRAASVAMSSLVATNGLIAAQNPANSSRATATSSGHSVALVLESDASALHASASHRPWEDEPGNVGTDPLPPPPLPLPDAGDADEDAPAAEADDAPAWNCSCCWTSAMPPPPPNAPAMEGAYARRACCST